MMALNLTIAKVRKPRIGIFFWKLYGLLKPFLDFISFFSPLFLFQYFKHFRYEFINFKNYFTASLIILLTLLVTVIFAKLVHRPPYFFFIIPIIINALYGGVGPAIFSILAGVVMINLVMNDFEFSDNSFMLNSTKIAFILEGVLISWISITQKRKQQQISINLLQEQHARLIAQNTSQNLKRLEKQKDDFIAIAAHELRNPLASIKAFAQILETKTAQSRNNQVKQYITKMEEQTQRLDDLVNQLFDVSSMSSGQMRLRKKLINFDEFILTTIIDLQHTIDTHKLIVEGHTKSEVEIDPERTREIVINLVINAVKYSPNSGQVIIYLSANQEQVVFSVKDFGEGISPRDQKRIFERFYRADSHLVSGLGLGLYIASELVRLHHGKIWLSSTLGKGSTFFFTLPKRRSTLLNLP